MSKWADTALAEWRRYREPRDTSSRLRPVGPALTSMLAKLGLRDAMDERAVRAAWVEIVGPFLATQSSPEKIRGAVLHVRVNQPSVRFELERMWKAEVTRKLGEKFGATKIREVHFFT